MKDGNILLESCSGTVRLVRDRVDCRAGGYCVGRPIWYMQMLGACRMATGTFGLVMLG